MSAEQIAALCEAAMKKIIQGINRSAGQHIRAMRKGRVSTDAQLLVKREN